MLHEHQPKYNQILSGSKERQIKMYSCQHSDGDRSHLKTQNLYDKSQHKRKEIHIKNKTKYLHQLRVTALSSISGSSLPWLRSLKEI